MEKKLLPKLRFSKFIESKDWEEKLLEEVAVFLKGRGISKADISQTGSRYGELYTAYNEIIDTVISFTDLVADELILSEPNDVIIPSSGETQNDIATASCVLKGGIALGGDLNILRSKINGVYMAYYLSHNRKKAISKLAQGNAVVHLYSNQLKKLKINYPKTKEEQQKIADCLSSLDDLITAENEKLDALKNHKKGLMQQLFPIEGEKVPKLRFLEFKDIGDWEEKNLGSVIEIKGRIGYRGYTIQDIVGKGLGAVSLSPSNIDKSGSLKYEKSTYITWEKYEQSPEIMIEDGFTILVKTGSTYGKVAFVENLPEKSTINPQMVVLKPKKISPLFLFLSVNGFSIQEQIKKTVVGGAIPTLSQDSISKFRTFLPGIEEQTKIANCISSLNEQIILQTQKIEDLKLHKKGLIQKLFPTIY